MWSCLISIERGEAASAVDVLEHHIPTRRMLPLPHTDVAAWDGAHDVAISSLLPGDAREIATGVCSLSQAQFAGQWKRRWELRVFILTSSDRPAATCTL